MARLYFRALSEFLPEEFRFEKRTRQPPADPFNSMLSFGYTLLMYDFYSAIERTRLSPYIGYLHALKDGHPALASDLMEPWRAAIVDAFCLALVTHHEIDGLVLCEKRGEWWDVPHARGAAYFHSGV